MSDDDNDDFHVESFASFIVAGSIAIQSALGILPPDIRAQVPKIVEVDKSDSITNFLKHKDNITTNAFVISKYPNTVFVAKWSQAYKRAMNGDQKAIKALASYIAHEVYHLQHGPAEGPAYQQQLDVLKAVNGSKEDIAAVEKSLKHVDPTYKLKY